MRRLVVLALALTMTACRATAPAAPAPVPAAAPAPATAVSAPSNEAILFATLWVQTAAEYRAAALQTFNAAGRALDPLLADSAATAAVEQTGASAALPPAIVVDIDETMLDNSPFEARLIRDGGAYTEEKWAAWVDERAAGAIPGAAELARNAAEKGVVVYYVSNRSAAAEAATRDNLRAAGFPLDERYDTVLLRGEKDAWKASDKSARRAEIAARHRIILMVGDDLGDFLPNVRISREERQALVDRHAAWWGTRWFVVPNPMYGSWEGALTSGAAPAERRQRLLDALRTGR